MLRSILLIVILFLTFSNSLSAINFNISFSAYGARNNYDYVVVENITQGLTVTVPAGSTLNLVDVTAVGNVISDKLLSVYPNPVDKKALVSFFSEQGGNTQCSVFGIDGKCIVRYAKVLNAGINNFQISLPKGIFSLIVNENGINHTAKIISQTDNKTEFEFAGNEKVNYSILQKNKSAVIQLKYNAGDILLMKAYAGNFVSILSEIIMADKNINFNLVECVDQEGINYPVVTIGTQVWLADNLKTSRYRNNVTIPDKSNDVTWGTITTPAYTDYSSPITSTTYGKLYNWYAVTNNNNLAPKGWHIPTDNDWAILSDFLGGAALAGSKLKEKGNTHWLNANIDATNKTGFTALPGGSRSTDGNIYDFGNVGYWWSTTEGSNVNSAYYRYLTNTSGALNSAFYNIKAGMSVRCVMGDLPNVSTTAVSDITASGFVSGGNITFDGNFPIISRGVCWSTNQKPTINDSKTTDGAGSGTFTSIISGVTVQTTYYIRSYATNSYGTAYGT
ncbi:MAG TPA: FISUMP domain-containing protein, partial [Paludibacter sp.]|nr:FISUMP domain-containing protein [Paludibacter sp.]